jgi:hypothetical protein
MYHWLAGCGASAMEHFSLIIIRVVMFLIHIYRLTTVDVLVYVLGSAVGFVANATFGHGIVKSFFAAKVQDIS